MDKTKTFTIVGLLLLTLTLSPMMADAGSPPFSPPGAAFTGGAFWAGTTTDAYAYSWVATYPVYYPNEKEGVNPPTAEGEFGNTYGANIRDFEIDGASASTVILEGTVILKNIGPWPQTSYFEVGLGGSLNSWFQYFGDVENPDGSVYVIFQGNSEGGHDIFIQDYSGQSPPSGAVYSTTGTPGDDPVQKATFHFVAEFDLVNRLAYLTVDGVSVPSVQFGKSILAMYGQDERRPCSSV